MVKRVYSHQAEDEGEDPSEGNEARDSDELTAANRRPPDSSDTDGEPSPKKRSATPPEGPFKCDRCDEMFLSIRARNGHMKSHTNVECRPCGEKFANSGSYAYHRGREHALSRCKLCNFSDQDPDRVIGHIVRMHAGPRVANQVYRHYARD